MRYNDAGFLRDTIGMPAAHAQAFAGVAQSERCVIIVRATGPTCLGPLDEGYDTKGYRIHGKSCDWGPMAGFVMRDPRLNKYGEPKAKFNRAKHAEAIDLDREGQGWQASTIPLRISPQRIAWLMGRGLITVTRTMNGSKYFGVAQHPTVPDFRYVLVREADGWYSVCFDSSAGERMTLRQEIGTATRQWHPTNDRYELMLAMTNPPTHGIRTRPGAEHFKAITGDYDLFAVWPYDEDYDAAPGGADHRPLGTVKGSRTPADRARVTHREENFTTRGQGTKLGNITNRIYLVCQLINSMVGRQVLWHSDEAARPFLEDVDLPVIAFSPAGAQFGIETIHDFKAFIRSCVKENIWVTLSDAWTQNPAGRYQSRLGEAYSGHVPADGVRIVVPQWYNN